MHTLVSTLLPQNKFKKLHIMYLFCQENKAILTLDDFEKVLALPRKTILRYIKEINEEIYQLTQSKSVIEKKSINAYCLNRNFSRKFSEIYGKLKYTYLNESLGFHCFLRLSLKGSLSLDELCEELSISKSYAYHIIDELNKSMNVIGISIEHNVEKKLVFVGREINIRLHMYNFFTSCVPETTWFFPIPKNMILEKVKKILNDKIISDYSLNNLLILCGILHCRLSNDYFLDAQIIQPLRNQFNLFKLDSLYCEDCFSVYTQNESVLANEELLFCFYIQILMNDIVSSKEMYQVAEKILEDNSQIYQFLNQFIHVYMVRSGVNISREQQHKLIYFYSLFFLFSISSRQIHLLDMWNLDSFDQIELSISRNDIQIQNSENNTLKNIEQVYNNVIIDTKYAEIKEFLSDINNLRYFISLTYIQFRNFESSKLLIYLHFTKDYITKKFLQERLQQIYQPDLLVFTNDYREAEIIITDNPGYVQNADNIVLVNNAFDSNQVLQILNAVNHKIITIID